MAAQTAVACAVLSASPFEIAGPFSAEDSPERFSGLQHSTRQNHCHEITSSEFVKDAFGGVLVPIAWSFPNDHAITPMLSA